LQICRGHSTGAYESADKPGQAKSQHQRHDENNPVVGQERGDAGGSEKHNKEPGHVTRDDCDPRDQSVERQPGRDQSSRIEVGREGAGVNPQGLAVTAGYHLGHAGNLIERLEIPLTEARAASPSSKAHQEWIQHDSHDHVAEHV
jgi:hypothetical protein